MTFRYFTIATLIALLSACSASDVDTQKASLGRAASLSELLSVANLPGPIQLKKHIAADWQVPLSGLLNLDHPKAVAAGIKERDENIQLFVYSLRHPSKGTFIVDSGISERFRDGTNNTDVSYIVQKAMNTSMLKVKLTTKELDQRLGGISGVLLTHIHLDHIMGLTDLGSDTPVYIGPGEADSKLVTHLATRGTSNRLLANVSALQEWQFGAEGIIDIFGDGSLWAIHSPGHSPGSTAYLARTATGPQLMIGDATHTRWGWDNQVEPGSYSKDGPLSAVSLQRLYSLTQQIPGLLVHPGHQD